MRLLLAIAALLTATPAFAADWILATLAKDNSSAMFVDRDSVETLGDGHIRAWVFYAFAQDQEGGVAGISMQQEYDCAARRHRRLFIRSHRASGAVGVEGEFVTEWMDNRPGDQGGLMLDFICANDALKPEAVSIGDEMPLTYSRRELFK